MPRSTTRNRAGVLADRTDPATRELGHGGGGIGTALIDHLEGWAAAQGIERIVLNVSEANVDAIRLYHALGYRDYDRAMRKSIIGS